MKYYFVLLGDEESITGINASQKELDQIENNRILKKIEISEIVYEIMKESNFLT